MTIRFEQEKITKNTIKFAEVLENKADAVKIGMLYVQKAALKDIGWQTGQVLEIELKATEE